MQDLQSRSQGLAFSGGAALIAKGWEETHTEVGAGC